MSHNIFAYCSNDSINLKDDTGFAATHVQDGGGGGIGDRNTGNQTVGGSISSNKSVLGRLKETIRYGKTRLENGLSANGKKANYQGYVKAGDGKPAPNHSPEGSGRIGAFREAKRASGIPMNEQPIKVTIPATGLRGEKVPGRDYYFKNGNVIREHFEHIYIDNPIQNRGAHFNDIYGNHYDY